jgi:drug/metabolite transporter (DMT)-like permease
MAYLPTLLGLLTAFCWGTADYLSRSQSQRVGHYRTAVYMHVTTFVMIVLLFPVLQRQFVLPLGAAVVLAVAGTVNFFAFIFLYRAFHRGVISVVAPIAYTYPAVTTVLAVVLLGAVLTYTTTMALACIIIGVMLLSTKFSELKTRASGRGLPNLTVGVGSAALSALSFGAVYIGIGYVTPAVGYVLPVLLLRGVGTLVGFLFAPLLKEKVRPNRASFSSVMIVMGVLESVGFLSFNFGITLGASSLPIVAAISGMGGAFATSYAILLLRERLERNQLIGVILSMGGVFALLYLGG